MCNLGIKHFKGLFHFHKIINCNDQTIALLGEEFLKYTLHVPLAYFKCLNMPITFYEGCSMFVAGCLERNVNLTLLADLSLISGSGKDQLV